MFGNRKRKIQDDDESLVPHGLIWHATAEPTPEEIPAKEEGSLEHTVQFAQGIEQARRRQPELEITEPKPVPQVPSAGPSPVPWWRVQQPESEPAPAIASKLTPLPLSEYGPTPNKTTVPPRIPLAQSSTAQAPQVAVPQTHLSPVPPTGVAAIPPATIPKAPALQLPVTQVHAPQLLKREIRMYPPAYVRSKSTSDAVLRCFEKFRMLAQSSWRTTLSVGEELGAKLLQVSRSLELRKYARSAGQQTQRLLGAGIARSGRYTRTTASGLTSFGRSAVAHARQISAEIRSTSATATSDVLRPANTKPPTPSRLRALLAASALQARHVAAQQLSEWKVKRDRLAIDSRFWSSMTLSAIATVIVLTIVSLVPHYAAKSLPSQILGTKDSASATVDPPAVVVATPKIEKTQAQKTAPSRTTVDKPVQEKSTSSKASAAPKLRRQADDGYVAPDTYKYYGNGSKSSR